MKKNSKFWILLTSVMLILSITVIGTLAFLIDSAEVVNTFTVGNVQLTLDEAFVNEDGVADTSVDRVTSNSYKLMPGGTYPKDPTVTVLAGSEDAYVRMIMTVHDHAAVQAIVDNERHGLDDYTGLFDGWDDSVWLYETYTVDADTISFEFRYASTVSGHDDTGAEANNVLEPLFTSLVVPGTVNGDELAALMGESGEELFEINIVAHAIQSYSFADADEAWAAFDDQYAYESSVAAAATTTSEPAGAVDGLAEGDPVDIG